MVAASHICPAGQRHVPLCELSTHGRGRHLTALHHPYGFTVHRAYHISRAAYDTYRHDARNIPPIVPHMEVAHIIRAHDPDKLRPCIYRPERPERLAGLIWCACYLRLDICDIYPLDIARELHRMGDALTMRGRMPDRFERVLRRDEPQNDVQPKLPACFEADFYMSEMGRVERAAQYPDTGAAMHDSIREVTYVCV